MRSLDSRLIRLEQLTTPAYAVVYVWRRISETADQAIAERFPGGVPAGVALVVVGWGDAGLEDAPLL